MYEPSQRHATWHDVEIDLEAELDLDAYLAACRPSHRIKGLFFYVLHRELSRHGVRVGAPSWHPFLDYPLADALRLARAVCSTVYADCPTSLALYELSKKLFDGLLDTVFGRMLFRRGTLGEGLARMPEANRVMLPGCRIEFRHPSDGELEVSLHDTPLPVLAFYGSMHALAEHIAPDAIICGWLDATSRVGYERLAVRWVDQGPPLSS